jgi:hypothetical protein
MASDSPARPSAVLQEMLGRRHLQNMQRRVQADASEICNEIASVQVCNATNELLREGRGNKTLVISHRQGDQRDE